MNQTSESLKQDDSVNDASERLYEASLKDGVWITEVESGSHSLHQEIKIGKGNVTVGFVNCKNKT